MDSFRIFLMNENTAVPKMPVNKTLKAVAAVIQMKRNKLTIKSKKLIA